MTPIDAADLAAEAYGRKPPRYKVIAETFGLAVVLIMNRNADHDRAVWLTRDGVSDALCGPAEAFAQVLTGKPSPLGWRGGALAGLRTLAGDALHEVIEPWPWPSKGHEPPPVKRFWVDDAEAWDFSRLPSRKVYSPLRTQILAELAGHARMAGAWDAMVEEWDRQPSYAERGWRHSAHRTLMAGWSNLHERPHDSRWFRAQLLGEDPDAEQRARQIAGWERSEQAAREKEGCGI